MREGFRSGIGSAIFSNGNKYLGEFKDGLRCGIGEMIYCEGSKFVGQWIEDQKNGQGIYTTPNEIINKGFWEKGEFAVTWDFSETFE